MECVKLKKKIIKLNKNTDVLDQKETHTVQVYPKEYQSVFLNGF